MELSEKLDGKRVLVTGGTGTIGSQVVKELLSEGCYVTIFSRDQNKQFKMNYDLASKRVTYLNGDICDLPSLMVACEAVDYVVHCAASKHVPLCETNANSAVKVNVEGTRNVLLASYYKKVKKVLLLSTDKAVNPTSVMGATKFLAERIAREFNRVMPASVVRLGNVFASNGSVVPTFMDRIANKLPIVVNEPNAIRYFISKKEAGEFIVSCLKEMKGGETFIKKMKCMTIKQLADCMAPPGHPVETGSLTEGEKIKESLVTQAETHRAFDAGEYIVIDSDKTGPCSEKVEFYTEEEIRELLRSL